MTPEEKFNQDVWWILREIRNDEFLTPKGKRVEFCIRVQPKTSNKSKQLTPQLPSEDTQRKLLYKLQEWQAITDLEAVDNILRGSSIFDPRIYQFSINQKKFTEIYRKYENNIGYEEAKTETPVVVLKNPPLIKSKSLIFESPFVLTPSAVSYSESYRFPRDTTEVPNMDLLLLAISTKQDKE